MIYEAPNKNNSLITFKKNYENYIGGQWLPPTNKLYFNNISPVNGHTFCKIPRSSKADIDLAITAANKAKEKWQACTVQQRRDYLLQIADCLEKNIEILALTQTWDNGETINKTLNTILPLAIKQFRFFANAVNQQEERLRQLNENTVLYQFNDPVGIVGQFTSSESTILMTAWDLGAALAAGNCVILKPSEKASTSVLVMMELIEGILPPGVINIVSGFNWEVGQALCKNNQIAKISYNDVVPVNNHNMFTVTDKLIPLDKKHTELSAIIYFDDVFDKNELNSNIYQQLLEDATHQYFHQSQINTNAFHLFIHEKIYLQFITQLKAHNAKFILGNPLDTTTLFRAQVCQKSVDNLLQLNTSKDAKIIVGGNKYAPNKAQLNGYYIEPILLEVPLELALKQKQIAGPIMYISTFNDENKLVDLMNSFPLNFNLGIWSQDMNRCHRVGRKVNTKYITSNCCDTKPESPLFSHKSASKNEDEHYRIEMEKYQYNKSLQVSYIADL